MVPKALIMMIVAANPAPDRLLQKGEAVHLRHADIAEDEIEGFSARACKPVVAIGGLGDAVTFLLQDQAQHVPHGRLIVDHQHIFPLRRHLRPPLAAARR